MDRPRLRIAAAPGLRYNLPMPNRDQLAEFTTWCQNHLAGDEKGEAQIFLDRLFQAFNPVGGLDAMPSFD